MVDELLKTKKCERVYMTKIITRQKEQQIESKGKWNSYKTALKKSVGTSWNNNS